MFLEREDTGGRSEGVLNDISANADMKEPCDMAHAFCYVQHP